MAMPYAEVIGDPIAHSKSPVIHKHWLALLGINADYCATRVPAEQLSDHLRERRSDPEWLGCNVTIPHKEAVLRCLDRCSSEAAATGAVNCIVPQGGKLTGYNSDVEGIAAALDSIPLEGRTAVVIGGGGAARAALNYLASRNVAAIGLLVRNIEKSEGLKQVVSPGVLRIGSFGDAARLISGAAAIINASPLGMKGYPHMPASILAAASAQPDAALFDMVYDPIRTAFLSCGRSIRIDGLSMLIGQAARAFELFFGTSPPRYDQRLRALLEGNETS